MPLPIHRETPRDTGTSESPKPALLGRSRDELRTLLAPHVDRDFRADQVYEALHRHGISRFEDITTLGKDLRADLARHFRVGRPETARHEVASDGTAKFLLRMQDGASIEAVDIPDGDRRTLCLSSQAGCALGCTFCVTGYWGAGRNLTPGEIVGQWLTIRDTWTEEPRRVNLVFMGMGEPLLNLEGLTGALDVLTDFISWRRITVSTAGVISGLDAMARWPQRPGLAISLHAPDDARRNEIMPINRSHPLDELMACLQRFPLARGEKITFEYLLIRDFNDGLDDADALVRRLAGLPSKVNLIPINPDPVLGEHMRPPEVDVVDAFQARLQEKGLIATVRRRRGDDVSAACGQLRAFDRKPHGAPARKRAREASFPETPVLTPPDAR